MSQSATLSSPQVTFYVSQTKMGEKKEGHRRSANRQAAFFCPAKRSRERDLSEFQ